MPDSHLVKYHIFGKAKSTLFFRTLLIMKLVTIILITASLQVSANVYAQRVTLSESNAPLSKVFKKIEGQTDCFFWYKESILLKAKRVNIYVKDEPLEQVLDKLFKDQPLTFAFVERMIVVKNKPENPVAPLLTGIANELIDIKGKVLNENGDPVEAVTVAVKDGKVSTNTNSSGEFSLGGIDVNAVLVFSHVSMGEIEEKVGGRRELVIFLKTSYGILKEFEVSTGLQKVKNDVIPASFSKLDSANFHRRAGIGIIDRLDGTMPGVLFDRKAGSISGFPIQIRGITTLGKQGTSSQPLIVVDKFAMDERFSLDNINPNDVESITVLKDAAAASQWGTRAGNGVIVITTKSGRYNQDLRIAAFSNFTIDSKLDLFYTPSITPSEYIGIEQMLFNNGYFDGEIDNTFTYPVLSPAVEIFARRRSGLISSADSSRQIDSLKGFDTRNEMNDFLFRRSVRQQHYIGLSAGTHTLSYQLSVGYNRSLNQIQNSKPDDQFTMNANTTFKIGQKFQINLGINIGHERRKSYNYNSGYLGFPYSRLAMDNGDPASVPLTIREGYIDTIGGDKLLDWHYRPLEEIALADNEFTNRFVRLNLAIDYQLFNWLDISVQGQVINNLSDQRSHMSIKTFAARDLINRFTNPDATDRLRYPVPMGGILDLTSAKSESYNLRGGLNFHKSWGQEHSVTGLIAAEISDAGGYGSSNRFYGYNDDLTTYSNSIDYATLYPQFYAAWPGTLALIPADNYRYSQQISNRFISLLGNTAYTFRKRYTFYLSMRRDGANVFGVNTNNKWKPLWSAGSSWQISREKFYKISWMPALSFRASYGYTGNVNNQMSGKFTMAYELTPDYFSQLIYGGAQNAPNPDLKWEEVRILNLGTDFQLFKNRLAGSFEYFQKNSYDVITAIPYNLSSGINLFVVNAASLRSRGIDFRLTSVNTNRNIIWKTDFGYSHVKTIITKFYENNREYSRAEDFISYNLNPTEGQLAFGLSSYRWGGLDPTTGDPQGILNKSVSKSYQDIFNDTIQNQRFHGSSVPLSYGFLRNDFEWKGFALSFNIVGKFSYYFRKPALDLEYGNAIVSRRLLTADYYQRWQKPGDELITSVPSMTYPSPFDATLRNAFYRYSEIHVAKGDNIKLQDVRLSYQWTNRSRNQIPIQSIQVFVYPNTLNLVLWKADDSDFDPDFINAPPSISWTFGIRAFF